MRIAQIAPLYESVPPVGYGGTERVIAGLCDGLVALGHEVTLFAAGRSVTRARFEPVVASPLRLRMSQQEMIDVAPHLHLRMLADVYRRAGDFDIIHSHADVWTLPFTDNAATPTVITLHGRLDLDHVRQTVPLIPKSRSCRSAITNALRSTGRRTAAPSTTASASIDTAASSAEGQYLCIGRINRIKGGTHSRDRRRTSRTLHVAAKGRSARHKVLPAPRRAPSRPTTFASSVNSTNRTKPCFHAHAAATFFRATGRAVRSGDDRVEAAGTGDRPRRALCRSHRRRHHRFVCDDVDRWSPPSTDCRIDPDDCRRHAASSISTP